LQSGNSNPIGRTGHAEAVAASQHVHRTSKQACGKCGLFPRLPEASDVDFHGFRQTWDMEIPFVREPISPASLLNFRAEAPVHELNDLFGIRVGKQVEVTAEVWPMIQ